MGVQNNCRLNRLDCPCDLFDNFRLAPFAEVWYTLDKTFHLRDVGYQLLDIRTALILASNHRHPTFAFHMSNRFITDGKNAWQRLEDLLSFLDRSSLRRLNREEVRELGRIYRRTASDLAIARAESRDPRLVNYLNSLVIRAHGRIYRADAQGGRRIRDFFTHDFPQTFRSTWRYTAVAFSVFMLFGLIGFLGTHYDPEFSELMGVPPVLRERVIDTRTHWWEELNEANQVYA